jgi:adenylate cyclase
MLFRLQPPQSFEFQDELTMRVLSAIRVVFEPSVSLMGKGTKSLEAYLKAIQARQLELLLTEHDLATSKRLAKEAIALDPKFAWPYAEIAVVLGDEVRIGRNKDPRAVLEEARKFAEKAIALDDSLGFAHVALALVLVQTGDYDKAISEAQRAVQLEPGSAAAIGMLGQCLKWAGQYEQSIPLLKKASRLNPVYVGFLSHLADSYLYLGRYDEGLAVLKQATLRQPDRLTLRVQLTGTYVSMGNEAEARAEAAEVLRIKPDFSVEQWANVVPTKDRAAVNRSMARLREAGLK